MTISVSTVNISGCENPALVSKAEYYHFPRGPPMRGMCTFIMGKNKVRRKRAFFGRIIQKPCHLYVLKKNTSRQPDREKCILIKVILI